MIKNIKKISIIFIFLIILGVVIFLTFLFQEGILTMTDQSYCEAYDNARVETINKIVANWDNIEGMRSNYPDLGVSGGNNATPGRYQFIGNNKVAIAFANHNGEVAPLFSIVKFDCEGKEAENFVFLEKETRRFPLEESEWETMISENGDKSRKVNNYAKLKEVEDDEGRVISVLFDNWTEVDKNLFVE